MILALTVLALKDINEGREVCSVGSTNSENTTPQCSVTLGEYSGSAVLTMGKMYTGSYEEKYKGRTTMESTSFFLALLDNRRS